MTTTEQNIRNALTLVSRHLVEIATNAMRDGRPTYFLQHLHIQPIRVTGDGTHEPA